jgi:hypothetical protein
MIKQDSRVTHVYLTHPSHLQIRLKHNAYKGLVQEEEYGFQKAFNDIWEFEDKAYSITNPETRKQLDYQDLRKDPQFKPVWDHSGSNEFDRLAQGIGGKKDGSQRVKGTNTILD